MTVRVVVYFGVQARVVLNVHPRMSDIDEFDAIPDEFEGLNFDAVPALAIPDTNSTTTNNPGPSLPRPASAASSTQYSCDDDIDESYLVAIDALENRLGESPNGVLLISCVFLAYRSLQLWTQRLIHPCPSQMHNL